MKPILIEGSFFNDQRGQLNFNNFFDASLVKRMYFIENNSTDFIRGWQGHKVEQRWFTAVLGSFEILLIEIDNWDNPDLNLKSNKFILEANTTDVLYVPKGYVSAIKSLKTASKLLVMSDYLLNEIQDDYRFPIEYFKN